MEIVGEFLSSLVASFRFRFDCLVDDGRQVARRLSVNLAQRHRRPLLHLGHQLIAAIALAHRRQAHQFIEGQAERVEVALGIGVVLEGLRRHVAKRPQEIARLGQAGVILLLRQTEVGDPDTAADVEQQV